MLLLLTQFKFSYIIKFDFFLALLIPWKLFSFPRFDFCSCFKFSFGCIFLFNFLVHLECILMYDMRTGSQNLSESCFWKKQWRKWSRCGFWAMLMDTERLSARASSAFTGLSRWRSGNQRETKYGRRERDAQKRWERTRGQNGVRMGKNFLPGRVGVPA